MPTFFHRVRAITCLAALSLCTSVAAARDLPRDGVFVYSSFCVSPMSGDVRGDRITLRRFADGVTLLYEYSDGETHAVVANGLVLDDQSGSIRFGLDVDGAPHATVSAQLARDGASLAVRGLPFHDGKSDTLPRVPKASAKLADCKPLAHAGKH